MSKYDKTVKILRDLQWHCSKCELPGSQPAKTVQIMRQRGYEFCTEISNQWAARRYCTSCKDTTIHRKLKFADPVNTDVSRNGLSSGFRSRVKKLFGNRDCADDRVIEPNMLEVDHRFPQIRWSAEEEDYSHLTDKEVKKVFMTLSRSNNLTKSRACEKCKRSGNRGYPMGIRFWYFGGPTWEYDKDDKRGCHGCFWYDPRTWRDSINALLGFSD